MHAASDPPWEVDRSTEAKYQKDRLLVVGTWVSDMTYGSSRMDL